MAKIDKNRLSCDHHVTGHFRKKSIIFRDTTEHQEHNTKNRLSIPSPSSEKPVAEIDEVKKTDLSIYFIYFCPGMGKDPHYLYLQGW